MSLTPQAYETIPAHIYPDLTFNLCCCLSESRALKEQWSWDWGAKISIKSAECWIALFIGSKSARHKVSSGSVFLLSRKGKFFFFFLNFILLECWTHLKYQLELRYWCRLSRGLVRGQQLLWWSVLIVFLLLKDVVLLHTFLLSYNLDYGEFVVFFHACDVFISISSSQETIKYEALLNPSS